MYSKMCYLKRQMFDQCILNIWIWGNRKMLSEPPPNQKESTEFVHCIIQDVNY